MKYGKIVGFCTVMVLLSAMAYAVTFDEDVQIMRNSNAELAFTTPNVRTQAIRFNDENNDPSGSIIYSHFFGEMVFTTSGSPALWIRDDGHVGVGENSPSQELTVNGDILLEDYLYFDDVSSGKIYDDGTDLIISQESGDIGFSVSGDRVMTIDDTNNRVGIGTSNPTITLELVNNVDSSTGIAIGNNDLGSSASTNLLLNNDNSDFLLIQLGSTANSEDSLIQSSVPIVIKSTGEIIATTLDATDFILGTNSLERITIKSSGNVGIGESNPSQELVVDGAIGVPNRAGYTMLINPNNANMDYGLSIKPEKNPPSKKPLFTVESQYGNNRFVVEHAGETYTGYNDFVVYKKQKKEPVLKVDVSENRVDITGDLYINGVPLADYCKGVQ